MRIKVRRRIFPTKYDRVDVDENKSLLNKIGLWDFNDCVEDYDEMLGCNWIDSYYIGYNKGRKQRYHWDSEFSPEMKSYINRSKK